jgi:hypothetical protein
MPASDLQWAVNDLNNRSEAIALRRAYYEGRHRSTIPQGKTLARELRELLDDLNDNLCDDIVDEPVNRLAILSWTGPGKAGKAATESWTRNRGDARSSDVHRNGWMAGDGFTIVQVDERGKARWYSQRPEQMAVRYSPEYPDAIEVAAKVWRVGKAWRLNLYYPPATDDGSPWVERYVTKGTNNDGSVPSPKAFQPIAETENADGTRTQAVEALEGDRIPVFHYPADAIGCYGKAALSSTVIGLQDVLNKSVVDMVVAMEGHALPDRWATGIQVEIDPATGQERPLQKTGRERLIRTGSKDAQFGQFQQAAMDSFLSTQDKYRLEIARKGYLPAYVVSIDAAGNAPSGLSLLITEGRLTKRVKSAQRDWGQEWREQQAYMLRLEGLKDVTAEELEIAWAPAETRDETALLEALTLKMGLGLPKRQALIEAGYDEDDVDEWLDAAQAQAAVIRGGSGVPPLPAAAGGMLPAPPVQPNGAGAPPAVAPSAA